MVKLTEDCKTIAASGTADPRLRVTDTVPLGVCRGGNRGLGVNIGLGLGGVAGTWASRQHMGSGLDAATLRQAILQLSGLAGGRGLPGNGLDAATIQRKLRSISSKLCRSRAFVLNSNC